MLVAHGLVLDDVTKLLIVALIGSAASVCTDVVRAVGRVVVAWAAAKVREYARRRIARSVVAQFDDAAESFHAARARGESVSSLPVPPDDTRKHRRGE